jgi:hypothetical protein
MTALELAEMLESLGRSTPYKRCDEAATMLRKQHTAIKQLWEALHFLLVTAHVSADEQAKAALAATEEFK